MQLLPPVEQEFPEPVCFMLFGTLLRRDAIAVTLTAALSDCQGLCAGKTECEAITFNASNNKCVILGPQSAGPCKCAKAYIGYKKRTCPSSSTSAITTTTSTSTAPTSPIPSTTFRSMTAPTSPSSTASTMTTTPYCTPATTTTLAPPKVYTSLSQDPCVKQAFPALTNRTIGEYVCPLRNPDGSDGPMLCFCRALTDDGVIVMVANQKSMQVPGKYGEDEEILGLSRPTTFLPNAFPPSDFVCATVDSTKCPCDPCVPSPSMDPGTACTGPPALGSMLCPGTFWFTQNGQATKDHGWYYTNSTAGSAFHFSCAAGIRTATSVYIRTATPRPSIPPRSSKLVALCKPMNDLAQPSLP
ncbi:hypothetical protein PRIPAC_78260, partial [Pristionchus pacificus]|uniref:Apple domain-containing protein n=1 Tax=Pristionchus pacificus TaxID=54126 RepID=A0A2A6CPA6_PRIPA